MRRIQSILAVVAALGFALAAAPAQAEVFCFTNITNQSGVAGDLADSCQLYVDVTDGGANNVLFTFYNQTNDGTSIDCTITNVYLAYHPEADPPPQLFGSPGSLSDSGDGVTFVIPGTPGNLPSGENADFSAFFSAGNVSSVANGIDDNANEWLEVSLPLLGGYDFGDVLSYIHEGKLDIGMHVQSIGTSANSDSFVLVPETGAIAVWASLFGIAGAFGWYRRRKAT